MMTALTSKHIENDEGTRKRWVIQCKRDQTFSASHATKAIDEGLKGGGTLDVFLLVVGCDVSQANAHSCIRSRHRVWHRGYSDLGCFVYRIDSLQ